MRAARRLDRPRQATEARRRLQQHAGSRRSVCTRARARSMRVCAGRDPCVTAARCGWALQTDNFVFLLSSKAGGCGINLIGANRHPAVPFRSVSRFVGSGRRYDRIPSAPPPVHARMGTADRPAGRPSFCPTSADKLARASTRSDSAGLGTAWQRRRRRWWLSG